MKMLSRGNALCSVLWLALCGGNAQATGTLAPIGAGYAPMRIVDHHLEVLIDNGYARTEVTQVFENPNADTVEAIYTFPLPEGAALSEMTVAAGDQTLYGEVVARADAQALYEEQRSQGGQAGLAVKAGYQRFEFRIAAIPAGEQATLTFAYYQALEIDAGVGRYLYPLQEGGTDPDDDAFWMRNEQVDGAFSASIALRSAWPVVDVSVPDYASAATVTQDAPGRVTIEVLATRQNLDHDLVLYYRLPDDLPGRVEVIPYRDTAEGDGTFMMVLTPGIDLAPLAEGRDHVFVLDVSSSMEGKLETLKAAVVELLRSLSPGDRVRIVKFSDGAVALTAGFVGASTEAIVAQVANVEALHTEGGTNLYEGLKLGLTDLDGERATSVYLVTDGVANEGLVDGPSFSALLAEIDVRVYGFLMGNSGNWPLMQLLAETSGGFYAQVSNADDIKGQIMLAQNKTTHTALHDFALSFDGGGVLDVTHTQRKVHRGEQVVVFGRYAKPGSVDLSVNATITGATQHYLAQFELPAIDTRNPELERLWAFAKVRWLEYQAQMELVDAEQAAKEIAALGIEYQLVTDETSMVLLSDEDFARAGIDPTNRERSAREEDARGLRGEGEPIDYSASADGAFTGAPSGSGYSDSYAGDDDGFGGGAIGATDVGLLGLLLALSARLRRTRQRDHA